MHSRKAFDQTLVVPVDRDWFPSVMYNSAEIDTKCFSFVIVYMFWTVPVITGVLGVLGSELSFYRYENYLNIETGGRRRWREL